MAKLRQNHTRNGKNPFAGMLIRVLAIFAILSLLFVWLYQSDFGLTTEEPNEDLHLESTYDDDLSKDTNAHQSNVFTPKGSRSAVIKHRYYQLGYNERHEQADWVTYKLTKKSLQVPNVPRAHRFEEDPDVRSRSAHHRDYTNSGYSRGHMVPAGDMAFSKDAMLETFYMSNMSPQLTGFNGGIWRELEECVRDWAYDDGELYVASGPIFDDNKKYIGKSTKVRVPSGFYKVLVDVSGTEKKGIGFIIPHRIATQRLEEFAVPIDEVEELLGLDFFDGLYANVGIESQVESSYDTHRWRISDQRYQERVKNWNKN